MFITIESRKRNRIWGNRCHAQAEEVLVDSTCDQRVEGVFACSSVLLEFNDSQGALSHPHAVTLKYSTGISRLGS